MAKQPASITTTVEPGEDHFVTLNVTVPASEFETAITQAFKKIARQVRVPGFRPGKAPRKLLEAQFGTEMAREEALRDGIPEYYRLAVENEDVDVIASPEIEIKAGQESGDVQFEAKVQVRPVVEIHGYDAMRIEVENPTPTDETIDAQIDQLRSRFATLEGSDFPLVDGNIAVLDIEGTIDGTRNESLCVSDFSYEVGSGNVIDNLDDELRGITAGETVTVESTLPETVGSLAGSNATFVVAIKATQQKILPDLTDDWAAEASEFETIEALRADIAKRLTMMGTMNARMALRDKAVEGLAALVELDPPAPLVDAEMERRLHDLAHRLEHQGMNIAQYLAATGQDQQAFVDALREGCTAAVRADLALRAVVRTEEIQVTDAQVDLEIERLAQQMREKPVRIRRDLERRGVLAAVRTDIARSNALQWVVDHAQVFDTEGAPIELTLPELDLADHLHDHEHDHVEEDHDHDHDHDHHH